LESAGRKAHWEIQRIPLGEYRNLDELPPSASAFARIFQFGMRRKGEINMRRRDLITLVSGAAAWPLAVHAAGPDQCIRRCRPMLFFWGHRRGRCQQFRLQFSLELFDRGTDQGDSLSIAGYRGNRSCVEGICLNLTVEKRSFGRLWQIPRTEVIESPHKALCTRAT